MAEKSPVVVLTWHDLSRMLELAERHYLPLASAGVITAAMGVPGGGDVLAAVIAHRVGLQLLVPHSPDDRPETTLVVDADLGSGLVRETFSLYPHFFAWVGRGYPACRCVVSSNWPEDARFVFPWERRDDLDLMSGRRKNVSRCH